VRELAADGTEIVVQHERCDLADCTALDSGAAAMKVTTITRNGSTQVAPTRVTYLDVLGRTVLEQVEAIEPGQGWHSRRTGYDNRNRVSLSIAAGARRGRAVVRLRRSRLHLVRIRSARPRHRETRPDGGISSAS